MTWNKKHNHSWFITPWFPCNFISIILTWLEFDLVKCMLCLICFVNSIRLFMRLEVAQGISWGPASLSAWALGLSTSLGMIPPYKHHGSPWHLLASMFRSAPGGRTKTARHAESSQRDKKETWTYTGWAPQDSVQLRYKWLNSMVCGRYRVTIVTIVHAVYWPTYGGTILYGHLENSRKPSDFIGKSSPNEDFSYGRSHRRVLNKDSNSCWIISLGTRSKKKKAQPMLDNFDKKEQF